MCLYDDTIFLQNALRSVTLETYTFRKDTIPIGCSLVTNRSSAGECVCVKMAARVELYLVFVTVVHNVYSNSILEYSIFEESPANTFIGDVASDSKFNEQFEAEVLENMKFIVMTQGNDYARYFKVDETDGVLRNADKIDRDAICPQQTDCILQIDIVAHSHPDAFQIIKVVVSVNDQNDNAPTFRDRTTTRSIPEDTPPRTSISIPPAEDIDSPQYGVKGYQIIGPVEFELKVTHVDGAPTDVHLVLKERLDRETLDHYRIILSAVDGGVPPKTGSVSIDIIITDVNDNYPQFSNGSYGATVPEDVQRGSTVLRVTAVDKDAGINGEVLYGFSSSTSLAFGGVFSINATTGDIVVATSLDYEDTQLYNLVVTAREKNSESVPTEAKATIRVTDVNDNDPRITVNTVSTTGQVEVSESASPGTFVALVSVQDPDSGPGGEFQCALGSDTFRLQQLYPTEYKLETVSTLDRETIAVHRVTFLCQDAGSPPRTSSVDIAIVVTDENDNAPSFTQALYSAVVKENNAEGILLMTVTAEDIDAGDNGAVVYTLLGEAQKYMVVNSVTGNVTARVSFDREKIQQIRGTIVASDRGSTPLSSTASILVEIEDVNDEPPVFVQSHYAFHVYENQPVGVTLQGKPLSASDPDSFPFNEVVFSIAPNCSAASVFAIDPRTGVIQTRINIDREENELYEFSITATDNSSQNLSTDVEVSVEIWDVNDHVPVIVFPRSGNSSVYLSSDARVGFSLPKVIAYDNDTGTNAQLTYTITGGNDRDYFTIDESTGVISVRSEFRHRAGNEVSFALQLMVQDNGAPQRLSANTSYNIIVSNDVAAASQSDSAQQNLTIVLAVVIISGTLIVVLTIAIAIVIRQDGRRKRDVYLKKLFRKQANGELGHSNSLDVTDSEICSGDGSNSPREVSFSNEVAFHEDTSNKFDLNWNRVSLFSLFVPPIVHMCSNVAAYISFNEVNSLSIYLSI